MSELWNSYRQKVFAGFLTEGSQGIGYWRDKLFLSVLLWIFPVSLIAVVPGIWMSVEGNLYGLALLDASAFVLIGIITFAKRIRITVRKYLLLGVVYFISFFLLYYLGTFGPGLLYLLAVSVFATLILPFRTARWTIAINALSCVVFGILFHFNISGASEIAPEVGPWIAVSSNLILLSAAIAAGLHVLLKGLQETILNEETLRKELKGNNNRMEETISELQRKNQELERFAYTVSHDLKEPVRNISSLSSIMQQDLEGRLSREEMEYLQMFRGSAERMGRIINSLLEYSRIGKELVREHVTLTPLIEGVKEDLATRIRETGATIHVSPLPEVRCDQTLVKLLFQNLISNAIKFRRRDVPPVIRIAGWKEGNFAVFSVADNGTGIPADKKDSIFEVFTRLDNHNETEGTGIGLAHAKKITSLHGGRIWVDSTPGAGSTFYFTLLDC